MRAPGRKHGAFLVGPIVPLVESHDTGAAPRNVVENGLRYFKPNAELSADPWPTCDEGRVTASP